MLANHRFVIGAYFFLYLKTSVCLLSISSIFKLLVLFSSWDFRKGGEESSALKLRFYAEAARIDGHKIVH